MKLQTPVIEPMEPLIARATVAKLAGDVSRRTVKRWEDKGLLTPHRIAYNLVAYPEREVRELLTNWGVVRP